MRTPIIGIVGPIKWIARRVIDIFRRYMSITLRSIDMIERIEHMTRRYKSITPPVKSIALQVDPHCPTVRALDRPG